MATLQELTVTLHPVFGHEKVRDVLVKAHAKGVLPAALLLHGMRGIGKQQLALWLARLTVCKEPNEGPCDVCGPCRMALALEHPDIHWYFPLARPKNVSGDRLTDALETARHQELADIRAAPVRPSWSEEIVGLYYGSAANIRARAAKRPTMADGPIFIVGQAEMLVSQEASPEAANALLKLLEEPPGGARFILTSSEPGLLLPTVRSRTVPLHVSPLSTEQVREFLERHRALDSRTAGWAAKLGQGSPGRALAFLPDDEDEPGPLERLRRRAFDIVAAATEPTSTRAYGIALGFPPAGARTLLPLFSFVEEWLRDLAAVAAGADHLVFNEDMLQQLGERVRSGNIVPSSLPAAFAVVERARELARGNVNPQLVVSGLIRDLRRSLRSSRTIAIAT